MQYPELNVALNQALEKDPLWICASVAISPSIARPAPLPGYSAEADTEIGFTSPLSWGLIAPEVLCVIKHYKISFQFVDINLR